MSQSVNRLAAEFMVAVAEETRIEILRTLAESGELPVMQVAKKLGKELVNVSHHLGVMLRAGLLENRRHGRCVIYSLATSGEGVCKVTDKGTLVLNGPGGFSITVPLAGGKA